MRVHQNEFYIYFGGFKHLVYYILIVCYSLDPVLVIWHVSLVIFGKFNDIYLNEKNKFGMLNLGHIILGKHLF